MALEKIKLFVENELKLQLHKDKVTFRKLFWGVDFVGYVALPHHKVLRTKTKKRIYRKVRQKILEFDSKSITNETLNQSIQSYLGVLEHADTYKLEQDLKNHIWFWLAE